MRVGFKKGPVGLGPNTQTDSGESLHRILSVYLPMGEIAVK
jgi:hypothetical protein